jgi:sugar-specific transcriptional regulator TrmB
MNDLKSKLTELGMSDKESSVYLAMMELGPSSVQEIAKKAGVNRATTYVMLESLKRRGLMSSVERGKKMQYTPESPEHLLLSVSQELQVIEDKKTRFASMMPQFMSLFNSVENKPKVRFFEGEEGVRASREAQLQLLTPSQTGRAFIHYDAGAVEIGKVDEESRLEAVKITERMKILYSIDPGIEVPLFGKEVELRRVPDVIQPFTGEIDIADSYILLGVFGVRPMSVIIESEQLAKLFQSMFDLAWLASEPK